MRIGALKFGGIGDCADLLVLGNAIKRKHPDATLTCFVSSEIGAELLQPPIVNRVAIARKPWHETVTDEAWKFDLSYEFRPYSAAVHRGELLHKRSKRLYVEGDREGGF